MIRPAFIGAIALSSMSLAAAQEPRSPLPPEQAPRPTGTSPAVTFLMQEYGISEADAKERLAVQAELMSISARVRKENDPAFSEIWIEHAPVFKVVFAFADGRDRKSLLESLPPRLRKYAQLRTVPRSRSQIRAALLEIEKAFKAAGIEFGGGFDPITGKFDMVVEDTRAIRTVRDALPPTLRDDVSIRVGPLPRPEAPPTGVQSGDWIAGGYPLYPVRTDAQCTFGFPVRFKPSGSATEVKGVLTARHCLEAGEVAEYYYNGHWITFGAPMVAPARSGMYDYMVFESTGLNDDNSYEVYYENRSNLPGISTRGYYRIYAWADSYNQSIGNIVCKSGQQTGLTCGKITKKNAYYQGVYAWMEAINSSHSAYQADISHIGDSGGAWFFDPGTGYNAIAVGLHVSGSGTGSTATALYMPLERINDHNTSVRLALAP